MKRLGPILFISSLNLSAYADILNEQKPVFLLGTENEIVKAAQGNGLGPSDISIIWHETSTDGYSASVRCLNTIKCNKAEVILSFTEQEIEGPQSSPYQNQFLKNKINTLLK